MSRSTVARHVANIYAKLGVHSRAEATLAAVSLGLVEARPSPDIDNREWKF